MKKIIIILSAISILIVGKSAGQVLPEVQKDFNQYALTSLQEKIFIHTDKNAYTAGELLWFKIYNVDAMYNKPLNISKVVYVEVLDQNQNAILQTKIAMKDGAGSGSLSLPVTLTTGSFILRAYTSWMKNFSPDYYFTKKLVIINPLKSPDISKKKEEPKYDIQFFPEGGNLVAGITSVVAFKEADQWGNGADFKGALIDQKNDTVAKFTPLKFGIGHFTFKPEKNHTYKATIYTGNQQIQTALPQVNGNGYVMNLKDDGSGQLLVNVYTNLPDENIYLFAHTRNVIKAVGKAVNENGAAHFSIDKNTLGDGISQITIFNEQRQPVCERLYFKRPAKSLIINVVSDERQYGIRKKVNISINTKSQSNAPVVADLSLSVYRLDPLQADNDEYIQNYLWLSSDLRGNIESPAYYFKNTDAATDEALDNLMLTQGWRRFAWNDVLTGKAPAFTFLPELNGPIIAAKMINRLTGDAAPGIIGYLGILGRSVQVYASKSDAYGRMLFNMKNFYGPTEIVAETNTTIDTNYRMDILSPFSEQLQKKPLRDLDVTPALETTFEDQSIAMQVQNIYNGDKLRQFYDPNADSSAFYGNVYKTYLLKDYTHFTTMEEVMREYVKEVNVTNHHNEFHIKVLNEKGFLHEQDPMVIIDGVPFFNMNRVFAADPLKIRKLEVVPYNYSLGPSFEYGIFSFTSYKNDFGGTQIDPHAVVLDYEGLQMQRQFYSPVYDTGFQAENRMPDFRTVLHWSPSITTNANGKSSVSFFTSDQTGKYIGVMQGITAGGEAGSQTFTFEVKQNSTAQINK
jgi:hypothetical protein